LDEVSRPDAFEFFPESIVHSLFRLRAEEVADASLEVADGFLAVAFGLHVVVDVSEAMGPAFELNLQTKAKFKGSFGTIDDAWQKQVLEEVRFCF